MNTLMVGLDLNPPWVEGIRNSVRELSLHLLNKGHNIHFLTKGFKQQKKYEVIDGITYHRIPTKESTGYLRGAQHFLLKLPKTLSEVAREHEINVTHGHSSYPAFGVYLALCSTLTNSRKIFSQYSHTAKAPNFEYTRALRTALALAKEPSFLKSGSYLLNDVIVTSQKAYVKLVEHGFPSGKLHHIPIGVDTDRFNPKLEGKKIREEFNIPNNCKVILFAGDLTPYKGAEIMIRSLKLVVKDRVNVRCIMLTKGTYEYEENRRKAVQSLIENLGLQGKISLLGVRKDIERVYAASDIVVLPFSQSYALMDTPRALLEAMAMGKPVVTSDVGGISEAVTHMKTGLLIKGDSPTEVAEAITLLLEDDEISEKLGKNGRSLVEEKFTWASIVQEIEKVYLQA